MLCALQVQVRSVRAGVLLDIASAPTIGMADRHGQVSTNGWLGCIMACKEHVLKSRWSPHSAFPLPCAGVNFISSLPFCHFASLS